MEKNKKEQQSGKTQKSSIPNKTIKRLKEIVLNGLSFINKAAEGEVFSKPVTRIVNAVKVLIVSFRKFMHDNCMTRASSITYTIIVSLVPMLTMILTFYSIFSGVGGKKEELFRRVSLFMLEHNIKINIDPIFAAISGLVDNAGKIGGISAVIMIFSATAMLRSLETSLNQIWGVKKQRPIFQKVVYYWAALTLGPVLMIAGSTVATQAVEAFSEPHFKSAVVGPENKLWVVGNKATIRAYDNKFKAATVTKANIDFDNQKVYLYNASSSSFTLQEFNVDDLEYAKLKFNDIEFRGSEGWIIGEDGYVLKTVNGGRAWELSKWGSFTLNDIEMLTSQKGFIAADNGIILETTDGGDSWKAREWPETLNNFNSIEFSGDLGIATASSGVILTTSDGGATWKKLLIEQAKRKDAYVDLNSVRFAGGRTVWITGDEGVILKSSDRGASWSQIRFREFNYNDAAFISDSTGYIAGTKGTLLSTVDGGEKWQREKMPTYSVNTLISSGKSLWAIGDSGMAMVSSDGGKNWKGIKSNNFIGFLINFMTPFAFIWLLFFLCYTTLPNTRVPVKQAAIGAAFTGAVWVCFILLFMIYTRAFARGTLAVYGALASIPLFLLMVYASAMIILFGAVVSYTLMHPDTYKRVKKSIRNRNAVHVYNGIAVLHHIYSKFESGKGAAKMKELLKICSGNEDEVSHYTDLFVEHNLIIAQDGSSFVPGNSSSNIRLREIFNLTHDVSLEVPAGVKKSPLKDYMENLFKSLERDREKAVGNVTLGELLAKR